MRYRAGARVNYASPPQVVCFRQFQPSSLLRRGFAVRYHGFNGGACSTYQVPLWSFHLPEVGGQRTAHRFRGRRRAGITCRRLAGREEPEITDQPASQPEAARRTPPTADGGRSGTNPSPT